MTLMQGIVEYNKMVNDLEIIYRRYSRYKTKKNKNYWYDKVQEIAVFLEKELG